MTNDDDTSQEEATFQAFMMGTNNQQHADASFSPPASYSTADGGGDGSDERRKSISSIQSTKGKEKERDRLVWKKIERKYWQILKAFQGTLKRDWLDQDDHLGEVMASVAHLRHRIKILSQKSQNMHHQASSKCPSPWDKHGFRWWQQQQGEWLTQDDIKMALAHDLMQHERMLAGARTVLASIHEGQEGLGRRLEEMMLFHSDVLETTMDDAHLVAKSVWIQTVDGLQDVFSMLAEELYRKQRLVQNVLDSTHDGLLFLDDGKEESHSHVFDGDMEGKDPSTLASDCVRDWSRKSRASVVDESLLQSLLVLGDDRE